MRYFGFVLSLALFFTADIVNAEIPSACDDCQEAMPLAMGIATSLLQSIRPILEETCASIVTEPAQVDCGALVDEAMKKGLLFMKDLIDSPKDKKEFCHAIRFCGNPAMDAMYLRLNQVEQTGQNECEECQLAMNEMKKMLNEPETMESIVAFMKPRLCTQIQDLSTCSDYVDNIFPMIFRQVMNAFIDSHKFCKAYGFCDKPNTPAASWSY